MNVKDNLQRGYSELQRMTTELGWRRDEMKAAKRESRGFFAFLLGGLAKRARRWSDAPPQAASSKPPRANMDKRND